MSADLATVVMSAVAAAAASADLKVIVQVLDFSAAAALWCNLMSRKMACYMPALHYILICLSHIFTNFKVSLIVF